jgi:hypothetical protein
MYFLAFVVLRLLEPEGNTRTIIFGEKALFYFMIFLIFFGLTLGLFIIRNYIYLLPLFVIIFAGSITLLKRNILIILILTVLFVFNFSNWKLYTKYEESTLKKITLIPTGTIRHPQYRQWFNTINAMTDDSDRCFVYQEWWRMANNVQYYKTHVQKIGRTYEELDHQACKIICIFDDILPTDFGQLILELPDEYTETIVRCYQKNN